jgi:hypothetical protein
VYGKECAAISKFIQPRRRAADYIAAKLFVNLMVGECSLQVCNSLFIVLKVRAEFCPQIQSPITYCSRSA